jgi:hypothetical protein
MPQITSPVPQNNVAVASQETAATNLLTEIKSLLNGSLAADNLSLAARNLLAPPRVTTLPASPSDGDIVDYIASSDAGVIWRLRYRAASPSAFKWEYAGGAAIGSSQTGLTITVAPNAVSPALLPTSVPVAGDYSVSAAVGGGSTNTWSLGVYQVSPFAQITQVGFVSAGNSMLGRQLRIGSLPAGKDIALVVASAASNLTVTDVSFFITPVRVG